MTHVALPTQRSDKKQSAWARHREAGHYDSSKWTGFSEARAGREKVECIDGKAEAVPGDADQTYKCNGIVSEPDCILIPHNAEPQSRICTISRLMLR